MYNFFKCITMLITLKLNKEENYGLKWSFFLGVLITLTNSIVELN